METSFFHALKSNTWAPPTFPPLDSKLWLEEFTLADDQTRKNIANAWLWLLNMEFKGADEHAIKRILIDTTTENYQWIRKAIPVSTTSLFSCSVFDGSLNSLLKYTAGISKEHYLTFKRLLLNLWFGANQTRVMAVAEMSDLVTEHLKFNGFLPRLNNLVQNLAWDVVADNPENTILRAQAARISLMHG